MSALSHGDGWGGGAALSGSQRPPAATRLLHGELGCGKAQEVSGTCDVGQLLTAHMERPGGSLERAVAHEAVHGARINTGVQEMGAKQWRSV
jgi:hypothetical protein